MSHFHSYDRYSVQLFISAGYICVKYQATVLDTGNTYIVPSWKSFYKTQSFHETSNKMALKIKIIFSQEDIKVLSIGSFRK